MYLEVQGVPRLDPCLLKCAATFIQRNSAQEKPLPTGYDLDRLVHLR